MPARTFAKALSSLSVWQLEAPTLAGMRRCARWSPELLSECDCLPDRPSSLIPLFSPSRRRLQPDPAHVPLASRSCPARVPLMSRRVPLVSRSCPARVPVGHDPLVFPVMSRSTSSNHIVWSEALSKVYARPVDV
eukprot:CAMPEP_0119400890 /NCGR_PEP_ID=MMETSP1334-20130426/142096_1 /TAXON_ID=127549 /ORGANISM="Calcidiscus leptoporus, Strain RCC1130" /LENGTH=134 /DNA_ID=CAMNT_0007424801 /DNA_START=416 /DNA_END=821 /DNA_ORIENTATION=+